MLKEQLSSGGGQEEKGADVDLDQKPLNRRGLFEKNFSIHQILCALEEMTGAKVPAKVNPSSASFNLTVP